MKCPQCRHEMVRSTENYRYAESGLGNVVLVGVDIHRCSNCGEQSVALPRIEALHRAIAMAIIDHTTRLRPSEIRFLRKWLGWSGVDFAKHMGVKPETVSRWENTDRPMDWPAERLLRLAVAHGQPVDEYPISKLAELVDEPAAGDAVLALQQVRSGWKPTTLRA